MYRTLQTFIPAQLWRRMRRALTDSTYLKNSDQQRHEAQFSVIAFRSNHRRKEKNTASVAQCTFIVPIDCMFPMLWQHVDCDVIPTFRNKLWVPSQDQHLYITIYFVTSHEVRIFSETWFFCVKCLSSGVFAGIFVTNSASNPVGQAFLALHCDCTCALSHIAGTAYSYSHEYTACLYGRQALLALFQL
jgi:hypothetical protein